MTYMRKRARAIALIWLVVMGLAAILSGFLAGSAFVVALCGLFAFFLFVTIFTLFYSADARRLKAAWESFRELPGEHLRWHQIARGVSQVATLNGRVLATVEGVGLFRPWTSRLPRRVQLDQETYLITGGRLIDGAPLTADYGMRGLPRLTARPFFRLPEGTSITRPAQSRTCRTGKRCDSRFRGRRAGMQ